MSSTNHHFLAILPLFAILSISPMQLDSKTQSRSIASEVVEGQPKYEARAAKIDRSKIVIDKDLDLNCYNDRESALRKRILEVRDEYKVTETDKEAVSHQKLKVDSLISSLVDLEEDMKVLKEKKAFPKDDTKADVAVKDFKVLIEGLLEDEKKNDEVVAKAEPAKEEAAKPAAETAAKPEPSKEEPKKDALLCELEEKNKVLTKQVEELLEQQKQIMQTMLGLNTMMVQMSQQQQQQQQPQMLPWWMTSGSMMPQAQVYPTMPGLSQGQWIYYPNNMMPMVMGQQQTYEPNVMTQQPQQQAPQLGNYSYQQAAQSPGMSFLPQAQPYMAPAMSYMPGNFGSAPQNFANNGSSFNFGV